MVNITAFARLALIHFIATTIGDDWVDGFTHKLSTNPLLLTKSRYVGRSQLNEFPSRTVVGDHNYEQLHRICISSKTVSRDNRASSSLMMAQQVSETQAKKAIDKTVTALRRDKIAKEELGNLVKVTNILGYGCPRNDSKIAVRFNAQFQKGGMGRITLPFGLGESKSNSGGDKGQRGTMVGQVKASVDEATGKVLECSVFRDLGYGRSFNLKC